MSLMRREIGEEEIGFSWKRANTQRAQFRGQTFSPLTKLRDPFADLVFSVIKL